MYLVQKSTYSENFFILNSFSTQKVGVPKSTCPKELPILKKWLLGRSFALKFSYSEKNDCCEEVTVLKKKFIRKGNTSEEIAAPKK